MKKLLLLISIIAFMASCAEPEFKWSVHVEVYEVLTQEWNDVVVRRDSREYDEIVFCTMSEIDDYCETKYFYEHRDRYLLTKRLMYSDRKLKLR